MICGAFLVATVFVSSCEYGGEDGNEDGGDDGNEAGSGHGLTARDDAVLWLARCAWRWRPMVLRGGSARGGSAARAPGAGRAGRRSLRAPIPPRHAAGTVVLARLWGVAADWLDRDVQAERLHDQQSAGKGTDERDAKPQGSYGFGHGIEGLNPSASQAEAGVISARLGRLDCWLAPEQSRTREGSQGRVRRFSWRREASCAEYGAQRVSALRCQAACAPCFHC